MFFSSWLRQFSCLGGSPERCERAVEGAPALRVRRTCGTKLYHRHPRFPAMYQLWQLTKTSFRLGVVHRHHPALNFPVYVTWYVIIPFLGLYGYMIYVINYIILCEFCIMLQYTIPMPLPGSEQLLFDAWPQPTAGAMAGLQCLCTNGTSVLESKWSDGTEEKDFNL